MLRIKKHNADIGIKEIKSKAGCFGVSKKGARMRRFLLKFKEEFRMFNLSESMCLLFDNKAEGQFLNNTAISINPPKIKYKQGVFFAVNNLI